LNNMLARATRTLGNTQCPLSGAALRDACIRARQIDAHTVMPAPRQLSMLTPLLAPAQSEAAPLTDVFGREKRIQCFGEHLFAHAATAIRHANRHVIARRQAGRTLRRQHVCIATVKAEIDLHQLDLRHIDQGRP